MEAFLEGEEMSGRYCVCVTAGVQFSLHHRVFNDLQYRELRFLAVALIGSSPTPYPPPTGDTQEDGERETTC
jgi:hypothetical protein